MKKRKLLTGVDYEKQKRFQPGGKAAAAEAERDRADSRRIPRK